jgi:universal stress protein A
MANKALIAIELADLPAKEVLEKAASVLASGQRCDVVNVVDPTSVGYSIDPTMSGKMYQEQYEQAIARTEARLAEICDATDLPIDQQIVRYGRVAHEVHELLNTGEYDCLMIGTHGYHGWQRVLGSKASSILHGVPVDTYVFATPERA